MVAARCDLVKYTACIRGKCAVKKTVKCRDVCKVTGFVSYPNNHPLLKVPRIQKCIKPITHLDPSLRRRQNQVWQKASFVKVTSNYGRRAIKFSNGARADYGYCEKWDEVQVESCNKKLCEGKWGAVACRPVAMTA